MKGQLPVKDQLDIIAVLTALAGVMFTPAAAAIVGPYAAIVIAAMTGAAFGLSRRGPSSRWEAIKFQGRAIFMAILLTVTICNLLETYVFQREVKWFLVPVALGIGWMGDDWPKVLSWITSTLKRIVLRWAKEKGAPTDD